MGRYDDLLEVQSRHEGASRPSRYGDLLDQPAPPPRASRYGDLVSSASGSASLRKSTAGERMQRQRQDSEQIQAQREQVEGLVRYLAPAVNPLAVSGTVLTSPAAQSFLNAGSQAMAPIARAAFSTERAEDLAGNLGPATRAGLQDQGRTTTQHLESIRPTGTNDALDNPILRKGLMGMVGPMGMVASDYVNPNDIRQGLKNSIEYATGTALTDGTENLGPLTQRGLDRKAQSLQQRQREILQAEGAEVSGGIEGALARGVQGSRTMPETTFDVAREAGMSPEIALATELVMDPQNIIEALPLARIAGAGKNIAGRLARNFGADDLGEAFVRGIDDTGAELAARNADITNAAPRRLRDAQQVVTERSPGRYSDLLDEPASPTLPTAREAAQRRLADRDQAEADAVMTRARQEEVAVQERLAALGGPAPELVLPGRRATPNLVLPDSAGPRAVRETISPEREAEAAALLAEGKVREAEAILRPRQSALDPTAAPKPEARRLPTAAEAARAREEEILSRPERAPRGEAVLLDAPQGPRPALEIPGGGPRAVRETISAELTAERDALKAELTAERDALKAQVDELARVEAEAASARQAQADLAAQAAAETEAQAARARPRADLPEANPDFAPTLPKQRTEVNVPTVNPERPLSRWDAFVEDDAPSAPKPGRYADLMDGQEASAFRQAYLRGDAQIPGPASLEQGYAGQRLQMGTPVPQPAPGRGTPPPAQLPTVPMPTPGAPQPSRRQSIGQALTAFFTGRRPGQVKSKPELIRGMAATMEKMDGVKSVYGTGAGANRRTPARYLTNQKLIEVKRGNLDGFIHELGHGFDERQAGHFSRRAELADELDTLGSQGHSSWQPGMDDLRRRQEGVAEFVRLKFEDPERVARDYPKMNAAFEQHLDEMGDLGAEWRQHMDDLQLRIKSEPAAQAAAHLKSRPDQKWKTGSIANTVAGWLDRYSPTRAIDDVVTEMRGRALAPSEKIYTQARLLKNLTKVKVKEFQESLKAVLKPINDMGAEASRHFEEFLTARHALEMEEQGLATGLTKEHWQALIDARRSPEFEQVADDLYKWQRSVNDYAIAEGNLDPMQAEAWYAKWKYYVPTNREMENVIGQVDPKGFAAAGSKGLKAGRGPVSWVHRKKGGQQNIYLPLEQMLENMVKTVESTERNRIGKMLSKAWDEAARPGDGFNGMGAFVRELTESEAAGRQVLTVRDGNPQADTFRKRYFEFTNPEMYQAFTAMDEKQVGWFVRFLSLPANTLRWGATKISLPFVLNNLQRDTVGSALNSRVGSWPIVQSLDGLFTVLRSHLGDARAKEVVEAFAKSGGEQGLDEMYGAGAVNAQKMYRDVFSSMSPIEQALTVLPPELRSVVRNTGKLAKGAVTSPFKILEALSNLSEQATRIGEFNRARSFYSKQNPNWSAKDVDQAAGFEAMDLLDFDLRGNNEIIRALRQIVPFSGSSLTGTYRNWRAMRENPKAFAAKAIGFLTVPTLTLFALNRNNPYYWQLTQQDRDAHWHIPIPAPLAKKMGIDNPAERFWRFKKPFLMGTMGGAFFERAMQWGLENDPKAFDGFLNTVIDQSTPAGASDLGGPMNKLIWEIGANWDSFRQRDIEPEWNRKGPQQLPSYLRSDEYSSITSRMLSQAMHKLPLPSASKLSPLQIDHIIRGTTGGGGESIVKGGLFGDVPVLNRIGIDPALRGLGLTDMEEAKAKRRQFLGQVPTENRHESENRFVARIGELREAVNGSPKPSGRDVSQLKQFEAAEKQLKKLYKQRSSAKDEVQRMRLNRQIVRITERLAPPTGRQKELRRSVREQQGHTP